MKVTVTQDHIDNGEALNDMYCPIALAIKDQLPDAKWVSVGPMDAAVCLDVEKDPVSYILPDVAADFIMSFDCGCEVEPFEFEAAPR